MRDQDRINYSRIALAIEYIKLNFKEQPSLEKIAEEVNLSPFHFQRLFTEWAGTTPKKFLQYISLQHAKSLLKNHQTTLFDTAFEIGLSGTGRLHDLFINIEGMSPSEFKKGARSLAIHYSFAASPFGNLIIASTQKGICYMAFEEEESKAFEDLRQKYPDALFYHSLEDIHQKAISLFKNDRDNLQQIKLHLKGTAFQLKVWEALLKIPMGQLSTYGKIAAQIGTADASRAVGTAIGSNPVAFLIPCHRVIQSSGNLGGYMWGTTRKTAIICWESAKNDNI